MKHPRCLKITMKTRHKINDTQHNDTRNCNKNMTQHSQHSVELNIASAQDTESCYADCHAFIVMQSVIMLTVAAPVEER
jgi:hypothetical protein